MNLYLHVYSTCWHSMFWHLSRFDLTTQMSINWFLNDYFVCFSSFPATHTTSFQRCNNLVTSKQRCINFKTTSCTGFISKIRIFITYSFKFDLFRVLDFQKKGTLRPLLPQVHKLWNPVNYLFYLYGFNRITFTSFVSLYIYMVL